LRSLTTPHITVILPDEVADWPAHFTDIALKVDQLEELIHSIITGNTERQAIVSIYSTSKWKPDSSR